MFLYRVLFQVDTGYEIFDLVAWCIAFTEYQVKMLVVGEYEGGETIVSRVNIKTFARVSPDRVQLFGIYRKGKYEN